MNPQPRSKKTRKKVKTEKTLYTFSFLRNIAYFLRSQVTSGTGEQNPYLAASMVFSTFSVEAFLNHLGSRVTPFWNAVELKLSPSEKLELLLNVLHLKVDFGKRPFQTFKKMTKFRNALAHGKTETLILVTVQHLEEGQQPRFPFTTWEAEISVANATRYLDDSKAIIATLGKKLGFDESSLFILSESSWTSPPDAA